MSNGIGRDDNGKEMGGVVSLERTRMLIGSLVGFSNARIEQIAQGFVQSSKKSESMAIHSHKAYIDCLESVFSLRDTRRCLAMLYVCNEIRTIVPYDDSWQAVLSNAMSQYVPRICALALRQWDNNVVLNVMRLPSLWKMHSLFKPEICNRMDAQCKIQYGTYIEKLRCSVAEAKCVGCGCKLGDNSTPRREYKTWDIRTLPESARSRSDSEQQHGF